MSEDSFDDDIVTPRSAEAWAMEVALLIMDDRGEAGAAHIDKMLQRFRADDNEPYIRTWEKIAEAFRHLQQASITRQ